MKNSKENIIFKMPIQRCIDGEEVKNLSDIELLAVVLGTGTKDLDVMNLSLRTLQQLGGLGGIYNSGLHEIADRKGIGFSKAVKIHSAFELGRRVLTQGAMGHQISSPEAVWKLFMPELAGRSREEFHVLILNNKNSILKKIRVSVGTVSESLVHPREVFRDAIREGGSAIIAVHNHPSDCLSPSHEDIKTTERLVEAGKLIGIRVHDHVIVAQQGYYSFKESGYIL